MPRSSSTSARGIRRSRGRAARTRDSSRERSDRSRGVAGRLSECPGPVAGHPLNGEPPPWYHPETSREISTTDTRGCRGVSSSWCIRPVSGPASGRYRRSRSRLSRPRIRRRPDGRHQGLRARSDARAGRDLRQCSGRHRQRRDVAPRDRGAAGRGTRSGHAVHGLRVHRGRVARRRAAARGAPRRGAGVDRGARRGGGCGARARGRARRPAPARRAGLAGGHLRYRVRYRERPRARAAECSGTQAVHGRRGDGRTSLGSAGGPLLPRRAGLRAVDRNATVRERRRGHRRSAGALP